MTLLTSKAAAQVSASRSATRSSIPTGWNETPHLLPPPHRPGLTCPQQIPQQSQHKTVRRPATTTSRYRVLLIRLSHCPLRSNATICNIMRVLAKVSAAGLEPATFGFGGRHSIQLSYADMMRVHCSIALLRVATSSICRRCRAVFAIRGWLRFIVPTRKISYRFVL